MSLITSTGLGMNFLTQRKTSGVASASLRLTGNSIIETASVGALVGTLSVRNGTGIYTYTILADPDSKFAIDGSNLELGNTLDYETKTSHNVTIQADNGAGSVVSRVFTIVVINATEGGAYTPSLDFSDERNSMYIPAIAA
jgi:hypothetical protein